MSVLNRGIEAQCQAVNLFRVIDREVEVSKSRRRLLPTSWNVGRASPRGDMPDFATEVPRSG